MRLTRRPSWNSRYAAQVRFAMPVWVFTDPEERRRMRELIAERNRRRAQGEDVVIDHIVPLQSPLVCGLHCADNLRIVSNTVNAYKSNHMWPDSPLEPEVLPLPPMGPHQLSLL